ncbi:MAG: hypothetical protein PGN19_07535 [Pseudomonas oryzihabitans]
MAFCYHPSIDAAPSDEKPMDKLSPLQLLLVFTLIAGMALLAAQIR